MQDKYKVRVQEKSMVPPVSLRSNQVEIQDRYKVRQQEKIMVTLDPRTNKKGVFRSKMKLQETKKYKYKRCTRHRCINTREIEYKNTGYVKQKQ